MRCVVEKAERVTVEKGAVRHENLGESVDRDAGGGDPGLLPGTGAIPVSHGRSGPNLRTTALLPDSGGDGCRYAGARGRQHRSRLLLHFLARETDERVNGIDRRAGGDGGRAGGAGSIASRL